MAWTKHRFHAGFMDSLCPFARSAPFKFLGEFLSRIMSGVRLSHIPNARQHLFPRRLKSVISDDPHFTTHLATRTPALINRISYKTQFETVFE